MAEPSTCMFTCRHPVWGGEGICTTNHHGASMCVCDAGFVSRDALGHASCVPYRVLVSGYLVLAALSLLTLVMLGRHLAAYRHVSDEGRRSRKTAIRLNVLLGGSFYAMGMVIIGVTLAGLGGKTGLNDAGIVQVLYLALMPAAMFSCCMIAKFWVESLPSQLIPAESFAMKLRDASEQNDIFFVVGCLNAGGISTLGVATLFVPVWPQLIADIAAVLGTFVTVGTCRFPLTMCSVVSLSKRQLWCAAPHVQKR
ncbi:unnamed protein product [Ectocarpus sp. 6 AP-2014]